MQKFIIVSFVDFLIFRFSVLGTLITLLSLSNKFNKLLLFRRLPELLLVATVNSGGLLVVVGRAGNFYYIYTLESLFSLNI